MTRRVFVFASLLILATGTGRAEKIDMSPEELRSTATHVVSAKVQAVYTRQEQAGDYRYTHYLAEVRIENSEKGDDLKKGELAYVRYWRKGYTGKGLPPPDTSGHRGLPEVGQTLRIYLSKNAYDGFTFGNKDGGFNVIGANGFEAIQKAKKP
jgi:hypothetical protein